MDEDALLKQVVRRLDILIALQLEAIGGAEAARPAAKIQRLIDMGIASSEVAAILGKSLNYVTATVSRKRKRSRKGGSGNDRSAIQ